MWLKNIKKINISTTTRTRETNYSAFERSGIGLSFCSGESLSPRAPFSRILVSFSGTAAARGLVVTTGYYWGLLHKDLSWKEGKGLLFSIGQRLLRKQDFAKNWILEKYNHFLCKRKHFFSDLEIFTSSNACAIQITLFSGTKEQLKQKCSREYGLLAKGNKNWKKNGMLLQSTTSLIRVKLEPYEIVVAKIIWAETSRYPCSLMFSVRYHETKQLKRPNTMNVCVKLKTLVSPTRF